VSQNPKSIVQGLYAAFAKGDVPAVLAGLKPDAKWTEAEGFPYAGTYTGPDAVMKNVFMRLGGEWEGFQAVPREFVAEGDTVIAIGEYSGTYKATKRSVKVPFAHVWKLDKTGKVASFFQFTDTAVVQKALK